MKMALCRNFVGTQEQALCACWVDTLPATWERSLGGYGTIFIALCLAASPVAGGFFYDGDSRCL